MGSRLREALRCLCDEIGWSYAVFWRASASTSTSPMHLVWGDGYVVDHRVEVLVNKFMAQQVHFIGEGVVGQAAATGSHQWILAANLHLTHSGAKDLAELNTQLLAGIQTIVVIPVLPHGVLQLGSNQMVMENTKFINHVRSLFMQLDWMTGALLPEITLKASGQNSQLCEGVSIIASEPLPVKHAVTTTSACVTEASSSSIRQVCNPDILFDNQFESELSGVRQNSCYPDMKLIQPAYSCNSTSKPHDQPSVLSSGLAFGGLPLAEQHLAMLSIKSLESAKVIEPHPDNARAPQLRPHEPIFQNCLEDPNLASFSKLRDMGSISNTLNQTDQSKINQGILGDPFATISSIKAEPLSAAESTKKHDDSLKACHGHSTGCALSGLSSQPHDESNFCHGFPVPSTSGNDLYDILGPDYKIESFCHSFDDVFVAENDASLHNHISDNSTNITPMDIYPASNPVNSHIPGAGMFSVTGANQLLDAVVSNVNYAKENSDDGGSCKTSITNTCSPSVAVISPQLQLIASSEQMPHLPPILGNTDGAGSSSAKSSCSLSNKSEDCSQSTGIHKSQISLWVESGQSINSDNLSGSYNRRVDDTAKPNRKRARPGENPRPRPKDRQMIMDRVKELREIVPNGGKCSIDALLEKTIKHMLFLQSVTKHADSLKGIGEPKFIDKEGDISLKENFEGGATWAFQVGSQPMTCPIIVEDLNPPRQLLVEMLCEQRGVFLEIADLIRGMGLSILKGVMEARKDKIWARFAVEANRDVTRMEIFLSLVRLLESSLGCSAVPQGLDNSVSHNIYNQSCIAATGASTSFM